MPLNGAYYYNVEYFAVSDQTRPEVALARAQAAAEKHGRRESTIFDSYNDAGQIIGYEVRSRHYVGAPGSDHPDKVKDKDAGRQ